MTESEMWEKACRGLEIELAEQVRINGMGGEREAALMGKVERLERELATEKAGREVLGSRHLQDEAELMVELAACKSWIDGAKVAVELFDGGSESQRKWREMMMTQARQILENKI